MAWCCVLLSVHMLVCDESEFRENGRLFIIIIIIIVIINIIIIFITNFMGYFLREQYQRD